MWIATHAPDEPLAGRGQEAPPGGAAAAEGALAADVAEVGGDAGAQASGGCAPAFAEVYREHAPYVWRVLRRLGLAEADVEDACQDVFLTVHRKLASFAGRSSVRTWLYGIAVRCAADRRRRGRRSRETLEPVPAAEEPAVDAAQPDDVARRQAMAVLDELLDGLDADKRATFVLYELEELSMAEVAEALGCPLQTAYSRLHAARATVEAALERRRAREAKR